MGTLRADGNTALFDSIVFALLHFEEGEDRRAMVLLTDGEDYGSRFSARQAALQARAAGRARLHRSRSPAWTGCAPAIKKTISSSSPSRPAATCSTSRRGRSWTPPTRASAPSCAVSTCSPSPPTSALTEGELSKLEVRVTRPRTTVRAVVSGRSVQTQVNREDASRTAAPTHDISRRIHAAGRPCSRAPAITNSRYQAAGSSAGSRCVARAT